MGSGSAGGSCAPGRESRAAGTVLAADVKPGAGDGVATFALLGNLGRRVVFAADDGITGVEPHISNGTAAGTRRLRDVAPGAAPSYSQGGVRAGGVVSFSASDHLGREIWRTDGTAGGTFLLADTAARPADGRPYAFTVVGDVAYFIATAIDRTTQLWVTDGAIAGTHRCDGNDPASSSRSTCSKRRLPVAGEGPMQRRSAGLRERVRRDERGEAAEVPIGGPQDVHAVGDAERGDARVVHARAGHLARLEQRTNRSPVVGALTQQQEARRLQPRVDLRERPARGCRRVVYAGMRDDGQELVDAGPRNRPRGTTFGEST